MPPSTDEKILKLIAAALERGESRNQISTAYQVSPRNITRISANLKKYGNPKAPPSGLKQGRPIKMTKEQAEAMLGWMVGKDYTFYVKDLTSFLHQQYGFEGCDGTVRRAILRSGFSRKLPWHKSQITSWIPPDDAPDLSFVYSANPPTTSARRRAAKKGVAGGGPHVQTDEVSHDGEQMEEDSQANEHGGLDLSAASKASAHDHNGIDPTLRDLNFDLEVDDFQSPGMELASTQNLARAPHATPVAEMSAPNVSFDPTAMPLDPQLSSRHLGVTRSLSLHPPTSHVDVEISSPLISQQGSSASDMERSQQQQLALMQSQLEQQADLIARLQRQLAQQAGFTAAQDPMHNADDNGIARTQQVVTYKNGRHTNGSSPAEKEHAAEVSMANRNHQPELSQVHPQPEGNEDNHFHMLQSLTSQEHTHSRNSEYSENEDDEDDDAV